MHLSDDLSGTPKRRYFRVAQEVLSAVAAGTFVPGERLPTDRDLAGQYGVSRATAREAVLVLELIGVVEVRHGDGVYLRGGPAVIGGLEGSLLDAPPRHLIECRTVLEPAVAELAAQRMSRAQVDALGRDLEDAAAIVGDARELSRFMTLGLQFHSSLAAGCGNSLLSGVVTQLVDAEVHPLWTLVNQHAMGSESARVGQLGEHQAVFDAVASGDASTARLAMARHLEDLGGIIFSPMTTSKTFERI